MRFHFSRKSDFKNLPLGTIAGASIYYGNGKYDYNEFELKKIDVDTWEIIPNKYGYEGMKNDDFVYNNQNKFMSKDTFYLAIPRIRFDMHPMYRILGDWEMEYEFVYLEQVLNDNRLDKDYYIKFGMGNGKWIINLVSMRDKYRKFWCELTIDEKKELDKKYGRLDNSFNTYL